MFKLPLPSGKLTKSYRKWPFIVDLPIKNGDFPWLCQFTRGYIDMSFVFSLLGLPKKTCSFSDSSQRAAVGCKSITPKWRTVRLVLDREWLRLGRRLKLPMTGNGKVIPPIKNGDFRGGWFIIVLTTVEWLNDWKIEICYVLLIEWLKWPKNKWVNGQQRTDTPTNRHRLASEIAHTHNSGATWWSFTHVLSNIDGESGLVYRTTIWKTIPIYKHFLQVSITPGYCRLCHPTISSWAKSGCGWFSQISKQKLLKKSSIPTTLARLYVKHVKHVKLGYQWISW